MVGTGERVSENEREKEGEEEEASEREKARGTGEPATKRDEAIIFSILFPYRTLPVYAAALFPPDEGTMTGAIVDLEEEKEEEERERGKGEEGGEGREELSLDVFR